MSDPLPTPIPLPDEVREMREKADLRGCISRPYVSDKGVVQDGPDDPRWIEAGTADVGRYNAADEVAPHDARFIVALVNWFDTLTATKPSGQVEREQIVAHIRACAASFKAVAAGTLRTDEGAPYILDAILRYEALAAAIERGDHLAALSTQVQTVGGE